MLTRESWAARFALKGKPASMQLALSERRSSRLPSMYGDASMVAAVAAYMPEPDSDDEDSGAAGTHAADVEAPADAARKAEAAAAKH